MPYEEREVKPGSILEQLSKNNIFSISIPSGNKVEFRELCDLYLTHELTKNDIEQLIGELKEICLEFED